MWPEDNPAFEHVYTYEAYHEPYEFDQLMVVREHATGDLYAAADSGCSCPIPFENHTFPTDYTLIRSWGDCKALLDSAYPILSGRSREPHDGLRKAVQTALSA